MPRLSESGPGWEAMASITALTELRFNGGALSSDIARVLRDVTHDRSIDGVNTLTLDIYDDAGKLLRSGIFNSFNTMRLVDRDFTTVQVRKNGPGLSVTLEDWVAAELRKRSKPFKVAPNTTNHVAFVQRLVREVPGVTFWSPPGQTPKTKAPAELARGNPTDPKAEWESSWAAIQRLADERGWRAWTRGRSVLYAPEGWLLTQPPAYRLTELKGGVDYIDFDLDVGKPVATVKMKVRASRFEMHVGDIIELYDMGPVNGKWIINGVSRSLFSLDANVTLTKNRPTLAEPQPTGADADGKYTGKKGSYNLGAVKPHVREAAEEVGGKFDVKTALGVGSRPTSTSDHPTGYAIDWMCSPTQGDAIADYLYANAARLKIKYIIWKQRIRYPGGGWQPMADRGSATANHMDHVHGSFNR